MRSGDSVVRLVRRFPVFLRCPDSECRLSLNSKRPQTSCEKCRFLRYVVVDLDPESLLRLVQSELHPALGLPFRQARDHHVPICADTRHGSFIIAVEPMIAHPAAPLLVLPDLSCAAASGPVCVVCSRRSRYPESRRDIARQR